MAGAVGRGEGGEEGNDTYKDNSPDIPPNESKKRRAAQTGRVAFLIIEYDLF